MNRTETDKQTGYVTGEHDERMLQAVSFEELCEIAVDILEQMPDDIGIVCGPISSGGLGSQDANIIEFQRRIASLKDTGLEIFDQMPFEPHMWRIKETPYYDSTRDHLLEVFYGNLFQHDKIKTFYFIPGWESSYGARWENRMATELGKEIVYLE